MEEKKKVLTRNFYNRNDSGLAFLLANIVPLVFVFFLAFIFNYAKVDTKAVSEELWYLIVSAILAQSSFIISALIVNKSYKISFSALKVKFNFKPIIILICLGVSLICFLGMYNFVGVFDYIWTSIGYNSLASTLPLENIGHLFLNILILGIIPPICEEVLFRGVVFNGLRKSHSDGFSVFLSALLFALMHGSLEQLVFPFIMGIVFAIIVLRTGSIVPSILVHMFNNVLVIIFSYIYNITGFTIGFTMNPLMIVLSVLIAIVAVVLLFLIDKFYFKHKVHESMEIKEKDYNSSNIFMIVAIIISVLIFIVNLVSSFI